MEGCLYQTFYHEAWEAFGERFDISAGASCYPPHRVDRSGTFCARPTGQRAVIGGVSQNSDKVGSGFDFVIGAGQESEIRQFV